MVNGNGVRRFMFLCSLFNSYVALLFEIHFYEKRMMSGVTFRGKRK